MSQMQLEICKVVKPATWKNGVSTIPSSLVIITAGSYNSGVIVLHHIDISCYTSACKSLPLTNPRLNSASETIEQYIMAGIQSQLDSGAVPGHISNVCPPGTKLWLLECGWLACDEGFVLRGANTSLGSTAGQSFSNKRRNLPVYCCLIDHPHEGLILWETGCGKNYPEVWGPQVADVFTRVKYEERHELRNAIAATGNKIEDIKKIIIGHLHLDHAGGLDEFFGRKDVEVWVHDKELKSAFWSVATGADAGVYLKHYLDLDL
jgi:hypothetical protein